MHPAKMFQHAHSWSHQQVYLLTIVLDSRGKVHLTTPAATHRLQANPFQDQLSGQAT